jgi:hypothetical protein
VGEGLNRWPAVHRLEAAHLYRVALEKGSAGTRYHAAAEGEHIGWLGFLAGADAPASSARTPEWLGWRPTGPGLVSDLDHMRYFEVEQTV